MPGQLAGSESLAWLAFGACTSIHFKPWVVGFLHTEKGQSVNVTQDGSHEEGVIITHKERSHATWCLCPCSKAEEWGHGLGWDASMRVHFPSTPQSWYHKSACAGARETGGRIHWAENMRLKMGKTKCSLEWDCLNNQMTAKPWVEVRYIKRANSIVRKPSFNNTTWVANETHLCLYYSKMRL